MVKAFLIVSAIIALIAVALGGAYISGALDKVIELVGIYLFKAKAKAEEKKLEAQGLKEGEDFFKGESHLEQVCCYLVYVLTFIGIGELKGNQQANEVKEGLGGIGGLKKNF